MIAIKLITALALTCLAADASDLTQALWITTCSRLAIEKGCPDADIPAHTPVTINFTYSQEITTKETKHNIVIENFTWAGLPHWKVFANQLTSDNESVAVFSYKMSWPSFVIDCDYGYSVNDKLVYGGNVSLSMTYISWTGILAVRKPTKENATLETLRLEIDWDYDDIEVTVGGLNKRSKKSLETILDRAVRTSLDLQIFRETWENALYTKLNTVWMSDGARVNRMISWCKKEGL